jgi:hypothetical protein
MDEIAQGERQTSGVDARRGLQAKAHRHHAEHRDQPVREGNRAEVGRRDEARHRAHQMTAKATRHTNAPAQTRTRTTMRGPPSSDMAPPRGVRSADRDSSSGYHAPRSSAGGCASAPDAPSTGAPATRSAPSARARSSQHSPLPTAETLGLRARGGRLPVLLATATRGTRATTPRGGPRRDEGERVPCGPVLHGESLPIVATTQPNGTPAAQDDAADLRERAMAVVADIRLNHRRASHSRPGAGRLPSPHAAGASAPIPPSRSCGRDRHRASENSRGGSGPPCATGTG